MTYPAFRSEDQTFQIKLGELATFKALAPIELDLFGNYLELPPGTILIAASSGGWGWAERFLIHERNAEGYVAVDLRRAIVVEMPAWEVASSFYQLFSEEAYPYKSLVEAITAVRKGIPLFSAPVAQPD